MVGKARRAGCTSPARVPDWTLRQACCPKDATLASATSLPKVRTFRTSETNCSWATLNVGAVAGEAEPATGVADADGAEGVAGGGAAPVLPPQAVSPAPKAAAAIIASSA